MSTFDTNAGSPEFDHDYTGAQHRGSVIRTHYFSESYWHQLCRRVLIESALPIELPPLKYLVRVDPMLASDDRDRCAWLQSLFDNLTPLLLGTVLPLRLRFVCRDLRALSCSHSSKITGTPR